MDSPPPFQTPRLDFRLMVPDDTMGMYGLRGEHEVMKWSSQKFADPDLSATRGWVLKSISTENAYLYTVRERDADTDTGASVDQKNDVERIVGSVGVRELESSATGEKRWEIGYMFVPRVWGRGYATEATRGLLEEWFRGGLGEFLDQSADHAGTRGKGLYAVIDLKNAASAKILDKCGFVFVAEGVDKTDGVPLGEYKVERV